MKSKLLLFVVLAVVLGIVTATYVQKSGQNILSASPKVAVDIGAYPTLKAEQLASLQRLSAELHQHPEANAVRIVAGKSAWRQGVMGYIKNSPQGNTNLFWYDDRFSSPVIGYVNGGMQGIHVTHLVSEQPIYDAARQHGLPDDVTLYNHKMRVTLGLDLPDAVSPAKVLKSNGLKQVKP